MQGRGSGFPFQGLTQVARRKQCFSGWQQSTGRDEQKLPDFFLQDELPALLGVAGAFVLHGLGRGTFLGKGSQSSPSVAPQKCSCYYQDGRSSFSCIPVRPAWRGLHGGTRSEEQEPAQQARPAWRWKAFLAHPLASHTCIWGPQLVPHTESHQDKVENFDK